MPLPPEKHFRKTAALAASLKRPAVYRWLITSGYFPESYVLPPCFTVLAHPAYGKVYTTHTKKTYKPPIHEYIQVHFPKTELTDRTFGIIEPELHSDIALHIARNWKKIIGVLFHKQNKVCAYSFPVPVDKSNVGKLGRLRSGRLIYEFIEMAERDMAAVSYKFNFLLTTDVKNFYPSVYTHSIAWALHGKKVIRKAGNRYDFTLLGNRLDKLFQNANDGCTNGVPIGPAVSDLVAELILASVDRILSRKLTDDVLVVRFKDDYRILAKSEPEGRSVVKELQAALKEFRLELNDEKTQVHKLPDGLFRTWVSEYHAANPRPKAYYSFKRFRETYLAVVAIDKRNPGTGVIDRFLADIVKKDYTLRVQLNDQSIPRMISLLLMLAKLRTKAFPKVLAIIEAILRSPMGQPHAADIEAHLVSLLEELSQRELENRYLIAWIYYFLRGNGLDGNIKHIKPPLHCIPRAVRTSRFSEFSSAADFRVFQGVKTVAGSMSMLEHLDIFKRR